MFSICLCCLQFLYQFYTFQSMSFTSVVRFILRYFICLTVIVILIVELRLIDIIFLISLSDHLLLLYDTQQISVY